MSAEDVARAIHGLRFVELAEIAQELSQYDGLPKEALELADGLARWANYKMTKHPARPA